MRDAQAKAEETRRKAAALRQDARSKTVVISEKWDSKAAKYLAPSLPFPYKDKDAYEVRLMGVRLMGTVQSNAACFSAFFPPPPMFLPARPKLACFPRNAQSVSSEPLDSLWQPHPQVNTPLTRHLCP